MFIAALFIMAKTWTPLRCLSVGEWVTRPWSIRTMEDYSVLKRNELSSHGETWRNLKCILISERSQPGRPRTVGFQPYDTLEQERWQRGRRVPDVGEEGRAGGAQRVLRAARRLRVTWVDACHYTFVQGAERTPPSATLTYTADFGRWRRVGVGASFLRRVPLGRGWGWGEPITRELSAPSMRICCGPETALKRVLL